MGRRSLYAAEIYGSNGNRGSDLNIRGDINGDTGVKKAATVKDLFAVSEGAEFGIHQ